MIQHPLHDLKKRAICSQLYKLISCRSSTNFRALKNQRFSAAGSAGRAGGMVVPAENRGRRTALPLRASRKKMIRQPPPLAVLGAGRGGSREVAFTVRRGGRAVKRRKAGQPLSARGQRPHPRPAIECFQIMFSRVSNNGHISFLIRLCFAALT
jgi:hypothetical protein